MSYAIRNRAIKTTLEAAFGKGKVSVRGARGTAAGWVSVDVDWTPRDADQSVEMRGLVFDLLAKANIDLGKTYLDDTCQHASSKIHLNFNSPKYYRTMRHTDGTMSVLRDYHSQEWTKVEAA